MITDLNRRHFRMVLPNGRFLKIKDVIRNTDDLQKWLQRLAPLHVYYTTATWLNPVILSPRPKEPGPGFLDSGIILSHDIAFDIDRTPLLKKNIEAARQESLKLLDHMTGQGYELKYIAFSGSKGFHLVFRDPAVDTEDDRYRDIIPDVYEREMNFIEERTALTKEIVEAGIDIDTTVTKDTRRIIRVPGTINIRTGYACTVIDRADLEGPFSDFIQKIPHLPSVGKIPSYILPGGRKLAIAGTILRNLGTRIGRANQGVSEGRMGTTDRRIEPGLYYTTYLLSNVLGTKGRHAVMLSFRTGSRRKVERILRTLIADFRLTDFYLFERRRRIIAICPSTVQRNRFQKILDSACAENAGMLLKYEHSAVRVGPLVNEELKEVGGPIAHIGTVRAPEENNRACYISRGHLNFIRKHGIETFDYPNQHGEDSFKVVDAILKM